MTSKQSGSIMKFGKSVIIYGLSSGLGKFTGLLLIPIYTKQFAPAQYGVIDVISTIATLAAVLSMLQIESGVSRHYYELNAGEEQSRFISTALWTLSVLSVAFCAGMFCLAPYLSVLLFDSNHYSGAIALASTTIPLANMFTFLTVLIRFQERPLQYSAIVFTQLLTTVGTSIWLVVYAGAGISGVFLGRIIGFFMALVLLYIQSRRLIRLTWHWASLKQLLHYSLPILPAAALGCLNTYINRFLILYYLTISDIGIYTIAFKLASVFQLIESAIRLAWAPFFWQTLHKEGHKSIFSSISKHISTIVFCLVCFFILFIKEIIALLSTADYFAAAPIAAILAVGAGLSIITKTVSAGPGITKKTGYYTLISFSGFLSNIICMYILIPRLGLAGVPISMAIGQLTLLALSWFISERLYYIGFELIPFFFGLLFTLTILAATILIAPGVIIKIVIAFFILLSAGIYARQQYHRELSCAVLRDI